VTTDWRRSQPIDEPVRRAALADPAGFIEALDGVHDRTPARRFAPIGSPIRSKSLADSQVDRRQQSLQLSGVPVRSAQPTRPRRTPTSGSGHRRGAVPQVTQNARHRRAASDCGSARSDRRFGCRWTLGPKRLVSGFYLVGCRWWHAPDLGVQVEKVGDHRTQLRQRYGTDVAAIAVVLDALNLGDGEQVALCDRVLVESLCVD
jgi:hypothetical protein